MIAESTSELLKKLGFGEESSAACEFAQQIREAAQEDAEVVARSERLTREDLTIVINARADDLPKAVE